MVIDSTTVAGFPALHTAPGTTGQDQPTAVFLHGAFADEACFRDWVGHFAAAGYDSWAPARRGRRGVGPERAEGLRFDDYVADTLAVIDAVSPAAPPVLVGHSLGGLIAQRIAELGRAGRSSCWPPHHPRCSRRRPWLCPASPRSCPGS